MNNNIADKLCCTARANTLQKSTIWQQKLILKKLNTLNMKPFFFFSFLPLLWQWPGKMMPSSVFPRPLLKGVCFQTAGSIIKKNSCLSMMPGSPWSTSLSLLTTPNLGNLVSGLPAKKLYMRKGQNCLGGLQTLSLASMAVAFPVLSQDSNGNYQEAFSVQGFLPLKECVNVNG